MNLDRRLRDHGLFVRGVTRLAGDEIDAYGLAADRPWVALVGNIGSSYWSAFSAADEYRDGAADPLDRWSRRIAETLAAEFALQAIFPFEGPPYYPFQRWARRAEGLAQSPLGIMIHPEHGLWHSYRFALLGSEFAAASVETGASPCLACAGQPCLDTCPVAAFDGNSYDAARCAEHLRQTPAAECHAHGCLARLACPLASRLRYRPEQGAFHLRAFLDAHP